MYEKGLSIIKNWRTNSSAIDLIKEEIDNYFKYYDYNSDEEFFRISFEYITQKNEFEGIEYRLLCWLNHKYGWRIKINYPFLVDPLLIDLKTFESKYLASEKRKELFGVLTVFISKIKLLAMTDTVSILIGGSFTEELNNNPNDLDCVVLLDESYLNNFQLSEDYLREDGQIPKGIDMHFLPKNFTLLVFKAYSHMIYLGNKVKFKDGVLCTNNEFEKRQILRIGL